VAFHIISNLGWLFFAPSATALFTRCAPRSVNGLMIGMLSLSVTLGSLVSGRLGGLYESLDPAAFWLLHAAVVGVGGVLFWIIGKSLGARYLGPEPIVAAACP
jgi:POT family proton-dependent oligopeptide transporter